MTLYKAPSFHRMGVSANAFINSYSHIATYVYGSAGFFLVSSSQTVHEMKDA